MSASVNPPAYSWCPITSWQIISRSRSMYPSEAPPWCKYQRRSSSPVSYRLLHIYSEIAVAQFANGDVNFYWKEFVTVGSPVGYSGSTSSVSGCDVSTAHHPECIHGLRIAISLFLSSVAMVPVKGKPFETSRTSGTLSTYYDSVLVLSIIAYTHARQFESRHFSSSPISPRFRCGAGATSASGSTRRFCPILHSCPHPKSPSYLL